MSRSASQIWQSFDLGSNFMTPEVVQWGFLGPDYVYELSKGTGFVGEEIIGVSVRNMEGESDEFSREWSELQFSLASAHEWIELAREAAGKVSHG